MKKAISILIAVAVTLTMSSACVFADSSDSVKEINGTKAPLKTAWFLDTDTIKISSPGDNKVYYMGETFTGKYTAQDCWREEYNCATGPYVVLTKNNTNYSIIVRIPPDTYVPANGSREYKYYFPIDKKHFTPGYKYNVFCIAMPKLESDDYFRDVFKRLSVPADYRTFTVKKLPRPSFIKTVSSKRKVTVTWGKVSAASKYKVYRSLYKSKKYKLVKTTKYRKFVDKKVKKGKRYYYKIRAVRTVRGTVKSAFSGPLRCPRVR